MSLKQGKMTLTCTMLHKSELLFKGGLVSGILQVSSVVFTVAGSFLLAKILGASEYGAYTYIFSWMMLFSVLSSFGTDDLALRETSRQHGSISHAFVSWSFKKVALISLASVLAGVMICLFYPGFFHAPRLELVYLALPVIVFISIQRLASSVQIGQRRFCAGLLPETFVKPFFLFITIIALLVFRIRIDVKYAVLINSLSSLIAVVIAMIFFYYYMQGNGKQTTDYKGWNRSARYFLLLNLVSMINTRADILMMGFFRPDDEIGAYAMAARLCDFIPFTLVVLNPILAPLFARLYKEGEIREIQVLSGKSSGIIFSVACMIFFILVFSGKHLLGFFGKAFLAAYTPLLILGAGQLFNAFAGPVGNLLNMAGFEKAAFISQSIAVGSNVAFNLILIPFFGMTGAAIATCFALFLWNLLMILYVRKKIGILPTAIACFK